MAASSILPALTAALWLGASAGASAQSGPAVAPGPALSTAARLVGAAAFALMVGNSIAGTTPDGPYTQFFQADGTVRHSDRDGVQSGRWRLDGPQVCLAFPDDDEDCRRIEVDPDGGHGAFVDSDGAIYRFDILPGNALGL